MNIDYAWEKFHVAVHSLAGRDSLAQRLEDAYAGSLIRLKVEDLPEHLQDDFRFIEHELTKVEPVGDEGSVAASARALGELEARDVAHRIVDVYDELVRLHAKQYPSLKDKQPAPNATSPKAKKNTKPRKPKEK